jgi:hypothetical protein
VLTGLTAAAMSRRGRLGEEPSQGKSFSRGGTFSGEELF